MQFSLFSVDIAFAKGLLLVLDEAATVELVPIAGALIRFVDLAADEPTALTQEDEEDKFETFPPPLLAAPFTTCKGGADGCGWGWEVGIDSVGWCPAYRSF